MPPLRYSSSDVLPAYGKSLSVLDWSLSPLCRVGLEMLLHRLNSGWDLERSLSAPIQRIHRPRRRSKYWGVSWAAHQRMWRAQIKAEGARGPKLLGYFKSEVEAARMYDSVAVEMRGRNAVVNFPAEWPGHSQAPIKDV